MTPGEIVRVWLALDRLFVRGVIGQVQLAPPRIRVRYDVVDGQPVMTDWLRWFAAEGSWRDPVMGEQVMVFSPGGDLRQGVALRGIYSEAHPAPSSQESLHLQRYPDGAEIAYDSAAHELRAVLPAGATIALTAPGGVTVTGDLAVTGDVAAGGDLTQGGVDVGSGHNHLYPNPNLPPPGNQASTGPVIP